MSYREITTVVDGAEESFDVVEGVDTDFSAIVAKAETIAERSGLPVQVYVLTHDHDVSDFECACVQYLTDHHPDYTFNDEELTS